MIEWLIGILFAYWWVYKRKPKGRGQNLEKKGPLGIIDHEGAPFGYLKNDETTMDLV